MTVCAAEFTLPESALLVLPRPHLAPGTVVRATDADSLTVGTLVRYGGVNDPAPGVPYVQPLGGGPEFQAVPEYLRQARPEEVAAARAEWVRATVDTPVIRLKALSPGQRAGLACAWCSDRAECRYRVPAPRGVRGVRLRACPTCAGAYGVTPVEAPR